MESSLLQDYLHLSHCFASKQLKLGRLLRQFHSLDGIRSSCSSSIGGEIPAWLRKQQNCTSCKSANENATNWQTGANNHILCFEDESYPKLLKHVDDPPPLLYVQGNPSLLNTLQVAIIGSRGASSYGLRNAYWFGQELAKLGVAVSSGMALGVDSKAHEGALSIGGKTLAVFGTGIDQCYPKRNLGLKEQISFSGALVSEFPLGWGPRAYHFPQRNRIISGLSRGILVVEAAERSGSLITARLAMEQNREVFALPGMITNPLSAGCHSLIGQGAKLTSKMDHIIEELEELNHHPITLEDDQKVSGVSPDLIPILSHLKAEPASFDSLLATTELEVGQLAVSLASLESKGFIQFEHGRYCYLAR